MSGEPPADTPEPTGADPVDPVEDQEARWAAIVAELSAPLAEPGVRTPTFGPAQPFRTWTPAPDPDDEHYRPPDPPPLPRLERHTRWALLAVIAGAAILIVPALLGNPVGGGLSALAIVAIIGGAAGLVYRMRERRDSDSDPDDGAVL